MTVPKLPFSQRCEAKSFTGVIDYMGRVKNVVAACMSVVLVALCIIVTLCDLSISIKVFAVFASVDGFFELYRWYNQ